jgi:hypothetical protein
MKKLKYIIKKVLSRYLSRDEKTDAVIEAYRTDINNLDGATGIW